MASNRLPAVLGGTPAADKVIEIVRPAFPDLNDFVADFREALTTGQVTNGGRHVEAFEDALSAFLGAPAICFNNGQAALMALLRSAGVDRGSVIVPAYTFSGTAHAVTWCGAEPLFADSLPDARYVIDPDDVARKIRPDTRAILAVDIHGLIAPHDALADVADRHGIPLILDSAQAFGSSISENLVSRAALGQVFSFHATKSLTTMEGGCLVSDDPDVIQRAKSIRNFGQGVTADCVEAGFNGKMTEICGLIGTHQLPLFPAMADERKAIGRHYAASLAGISGINLPEAETDTEPVWFNYPLSIDAGLFGLDRDELAYCLDLENVKVRKYFEVPCHKLSAYKDNTPAGLVNAERMAASVIALPVFTPMSEQDRQAVTDAIVSIADNAGAIRGKLGQGRSATGS